MTCTNRRMGIILFISFAGIAVLFKTAMAIETVIPESPKLANKTDKAQEPSQGAGKVEYKADGLRDPFEEEQIEPEPEGPAKPLPPLQVQGIIWGSDIPQAIINNKVLKVGDTIEEVRIIGVDNNSLNVFFDNHKYSLTTTSPLIKKDPQGGTQKPQQ